MESSPSTHAPRLVLLALLAAPLMMCATGESPHAGDVSRLVRTEAHAAPRCVHQPACPRDLREPRLLPPSAAGQPMPVTPQLAEPRACDEEPAAASVVVPCQVSTGGWVSRQPTPPTRTMLRQPPASPSATPVPRRLPPAGGAGTPEPAARIARSQARVAARVATPGTEPSLAAGDGSPGSTQKPADDADAADEVPGRPSSGVATAEGPSAALQAVAAQAGDRVNTAFSLAQRGAVYSARTELIGAIRMISEALDAQSATESRSRALAQAMRALREVEDLAPRGWQSAGEIDLPHVVSGHRTPVLQEVDLATLTPLVAAQRYYTFAQEQFASSVEPVPAGSQALYGLGKLQAAMPNNGSEAQTLATARAMVFYQAALLVDGRNFMAANELGVLLARMGQWRDARDVLRHGVAVGPRPELWSNLARVHHELGEFALAASAHQEAMRARQRPFHSVWPAELGSDGGFVRWVSPQQLRQSPGGDTVVAQPAPPVPPARPASPSGISAWLPWSTKTR